ncbi:hypothetical protein [Sphingopyxis yananensis]|uniref:hypothetical protein n=1 Tax=Sphingopyxis yananensis TaxID=2886687 RepID=UPI001D1076FC|nr:hypothetical protein [Sphingopyxis yananensis]MCC2602314.1 hypothetical protein [Sphingopyxis yananensis]
MSLDSRIFFLTMWKSRIQRELKRQSRYSVSQMRLLRLVRLNEHLRARLKVLLAQRLKTA